MLSLSGSAPKAQWVKNVPALQETRQTQVPSLGREDPLEEETATHSSMLAWRVPWTEEPLQAYSPWGHKELRERASEPRMSAWSAPALYELSTWESSNTNFLTPELLICPTRPDFAHQSHLIDVVSRAS